MPMEKLKQKRWLELALYVAALAGLSVGFVYLLEFLMAHFNIPINRFATTAYLVVFLVTLASCASIFVPVAFHISIMIAAAKYWDPVLVALAASVAGTLGETTGYYAGYLGKRIAQLENMPGYQRLVGWMKKYGPWGILLLSFQPILPFDVAGLLAGASKLPLWKFLLPAWAGRFPKYLLVCYLGPAVFSILHLPSL
ncbi:MAG TPA: VTT domain-containing protein [Dehalococcoidia bacterium]|nr:VTT domain-containing protein [Dehalococcoidia bacterium]